MAEKPIFFNTEMVQAILDGRKTMTRRVIKVDDAPDNWKASMAGTSIIRTDPYNVKLSRYAAGDRLWVRETWAYDDNSQYVYRTNYGSTEDRVQNIILNTYRTLKTIIFHGIESGDNFLSVLRQT